MYEALYQVSGIVSDAVNGGSEVMNAIAYHMQQSDDVHAWIFVCF